MKVLELCFGGLDQWVDNEINANSVEFCIKLSFTVLRVDRESFSLFKLHLFNKQKSHFLARTRVVQYSLSFYGTWKYFTSLLGVPLFITTPFSRRKKVSWVSHMTRRDFGSTKIYHQ